MKFFLLTKRPKRVAGQLPKDWGDGWDNIFFNVTFNFIETDTVFIKNGRKYHIADKQTQA